MRARHLCLPAIPIGLLMLGAPLPAAAAATACNPGDCLANSAVAQRVLPTTVNNDDKGDVTFFASQSGQLPNVVFILDNSTSMYELPYDVAAFPNSSWVTKGQTPNGCGSVTTSVPATACTSISFAQTAASCGNNTFFNGLKDASANAYSKSTTYAVPDSSFSSYFTSNNVYKFMEWTTAAAGGTSNGGPITFTSGNGSTGGTVSGTVNSYCGNLSTSAGTGGNGGNGANAWSMTQAQRCQQCLDEAGYYIAPGSSSTDLASGNILFKGNWLNFNPPKFIVARKVLTDFISRQSSTPTPVRVGVVTYDPNNLSSLNVPATSTGFTGRNDGGAFVSSGMIPDCNVTSWTSAATQTQQTNLLAAVRAISFGSRFAPIATPLAETLFNVGQFFTGDNAYYSSTFGSQWIKSGFTAPTGANKPLCVACQVNAVVLITDGEPYGDNNLPQTFRNNTIQCPHTTGSDPCGVDQGNGTGNLLDDVSNFLATTDLNATMSGIQDVVTFVIGVGLKVPLLDNAAKYGKSTAAMRADSAQDLQADVANAVVNIVARATAFSSTAIQTLEVGSGSAAYVPRFVPGSPIDPIWEGHLFRFDLFNEFVAGVDKDGDGTLNGVFLVDRDGDIVTEDDRGAFHKKSNNAPAVPIWDAGAQLTVTSASSRTIYTAIWDSTNNVWSTIALPNWDGAGTPPASFSSVANALGIDGTNACTQIQSAMATPIPAAYLNASSVFDRDHCAKAIIDYVRGYNVLNELTTTTSVTANRARMLGDIFHSSPVVVDPPVDQFICSLGLHAQCASTLYGYQYPPAMAVPTPTANYTVGSGSTARTIDAYEKYWEDHETRQRIVLVGANDGMLHAFDAGSPTSSPPTLNSNVGFRQVVYSSGTGNELWAFIPPDQLPRLGLMMRDGHQFYMDGDIMVRDVWVDGKKNDLGTGSFVNQSLVKQDVEFHTVAVVSERQGGTHFVALDVTDTTSPTMLWLYPPPCSQEEQIWGQTYGQFSPRPPPIGPVLLQTTNTAGKANYGYDHTEERWAVFLNGGHSPYSNRGRAAAILDVFTGSPLFVARYMPSSTDANDPALGMRFGFPATAALVDYGRANTFEQDGFFDTAVVGDEGGQLWTFRFGEPGNVNSTTGLVDNWTFGRAFEPDASAAGTVDPRMHQPIYTMASTTVQQENGWLRAYVGSGDRAHVRSTGGGDCRSDDPMSCIASGCVVSTSMTYDNGPNRYSSTFASDIAANTSATNPRFVSPAQTLSSTANACNASSISETVTVSSCPTSAMNFTGPGNGSGLSVSCTGSPLACTESVSFKYPSWNTNRGYSGTVGANSFTSIAVLADSTGSPARSRRLNVPGVSNANADAYDQNRLQLSDLIDVTATTATTSAVSCATPPCVATRSDAGWTVKYSTIDEKTVTSSTILGGCVIWSTLIPTGGGAVGCASAGSTIAPFYQADALTGAPNCAASFLSGTNYVRSIQRSVLSPPPEPAATVALGAGGSSLRFSTLEIQPGASEVTQMTVNTSNEMLQLMYSVPLTYDQHVCRHVDPMACR